MTIKTEKSSNNTSRYVVLTLLCLTCFLSNISQLPVLVNAGLTQQLNMPMWFVLLLYCIITRRTTITMDMLKYYALFICAIFLMLVNSLFTSNDYFSSSLFGVAILSIFVYSIGEFISDDLKDDDITIISLVYVIATIIVSVQVYTQYFSSGFQTVTSRVYAYASKNSISQLIFTAIVILLFVDIDRRHTFLKVCRAFFIFVEFILLLLLRSRASIIGFFICVLFIVVNKDFNKKLKAVFFVLICVVIVMLFVNDNFYNTFINNILFAGRDTRSLDNLSSGRLSILSSFSDLIEGHWITGIGALYFECFPLSTVLQFGVPTGIILWIIAYKPLLFATKIKYYNTITKIFFLLCIGYMFNSLFEGLAPFGPGVKCYYLWLLYGILRRKSCLERAR